MAAFVMIAPPNHGAGIANKVAGKNFAKLAQMIGGEAVDQLAPSKGWPSLEQRLATPRIRVRYHCRRSGRWRGLPRLHSWRRRHAAFRRDLQACWG